MAKKIPTMIQRLKKWKKFKGLKKEDIERYGTPEEIKLLEDFEEEHGIPGGNAVEAPEDIEVESDEDIGMEPEIEVDDVEDEPEEPTDDLIAELITSADDATLEALLIVIQDELSSRGGDIDISAEMPEDEGEEPIEIEAEDETF